jgi:hypothetical protein
MPNQVRLQYAVKLICGKSDGKILAPGVYFTAVNVHNPTYTAVGFRVKVAAALPGLQPGPISEFRDAKLGQMRPWKLTARTFLTRKFLSFPNRYDAVF